MRIFGFAVINSGKGFDFHRKPYLYHGPSTRWLPGCLVAYGSDTYKGCSAIFKRTPSQEEAAIAVGVYKLAVRISIGSGFFGTMFGWIAMLRHMSGGSNGMDMGALAHGVAVRWLRLYTGWYSPSLYIYSCNTTSNTSWTRTLKRSE